MKLYGKFFMIHIKSIMEYKTSFFLSCLGQFLVSFNLFLGIHFMFRRFSRVEGFTYSEVLLCCGITLLEFSLAEAFARGFDTFGSIVRYGEFDRILVRPRNEIFQVLASRIELSRIGRILQAIVMFIYGIRASHVQWNLQKAAAVILMLFGGAVVFSGFFVIYASICFFTLEGLEFMNIFTDGGRELGKYPLGIYGNAVLKFFTFCVPLAMIQYYPLLYLIGKESRKIVGLCPLAGILFLIPCYIIWKIGVKHYTSSGS